MKLVAKAAFKALPVVRSMPQRFGIAALVCISIAGTAAQSEERSYFWTQYTAGGGVEVRGLVPGPACPSVRFDTASEPMRMRAPAAFEMKETAGKFPVVACALAVPAGTRRAMVAGHSLPLPQAHPHRIVVLGDTGCRTPLEDCSRTWALPRVAREIAELRPDLIVHLGDYLYREFGCLAPGGCGYGFAAWRADFLDIAADYLFPAAPMILLRGNHETCARAGKGWFMLFGPDRLPERCIDHIPAWTADLGKVQLVVLDASAADDYTPTDVPLFRAALDAVPLPAGKENWLAMHKPVWGMDSRGRWVNATLQAAWDMRLAPQVSVVWSGHIHSTQLLEIAGQPAQIILGNGGADLVSPAPVAKILEHNPPGVTVTRAYARGGYGFALLEDAGAAWRLTLFDDERHQVAACKLEQRRLSCTGRDAGAR